MRGIPARRSGNRAAGMRSGAAQIKTVDRGPVTAYRRRRPGIERVFERHRHMEDVAADEVIAALQIQGCDDVAAKDMAAEIRCVAEQGFADEIAPFLLTRIPIAFGQLEGR